jgi:hypothetical protein
VFSFQGRGGGVFGLGGLGWARATFVLGTFVVRKGLFRGFNRVLYYILLLLLLVVGFCWFEVECVFSVVFLFPFLKWFCFDVVCVVVGHLL